MATERLDVRLDEDRRRKLDELVRRKRQSVSALIRGLIDREYESSLLELRRTAVREMALMEVEDVPDPDTLSRQLDRTHDTPVR